MDKLDLKEAQRTIWTRAYLGGHWVITCCGCNQSNAKLAYIADIPGKAADGTKRRLASCQLDKHNVCSLCQTCGKKLGFEW